LIIIITTRIQGDIAKMHNNHRFYLRYTFNGKVKETDELLSKPDAMLEKAELEADGMKNVEIVRYVHLIFQD
jgi:hypothetical protein